MEERFLTPKQAARLKRNAAIMNDVRRLRQNNPQLNDSQIARALAETYGMTAGSIRQVIVKYSNN